MKRFGTSKFTSFLFPGTFFVAAGFLNQLADSVIVGHVIGEDAFAGVNLIAAVLAAVSFVSMLIAQGAATNYSIWMGRTVRKRAGEFFMQGFWLSLIVGGILSALMYFGADAYFASLDAAEYVEMYARQYLDWVWPLGLLNCLLAFLSLFCCVDGDIGLCACGQGVVLAVNVGVSALAVSRGLGASGCALGSVVAVGLGILVLSVHFLRKVNTLRPSWHFSLSDSLAVFRASFGDAATFLCDAVLFFVLTKLIARRFGCDMMPVAAIAIVIWCAKDLFAGVGVAVQPLVAVYWGELNVRAIRKVMQTAVAAAFLEGLLLTGLFLANRGGLVIWLFGIEGEGYAELLSAVRSCALLVGIGFPALALLGLLKAYFLYVERPGVSLALMLVCYLALPVTCVCTGAAFGLRGMWFGLGLSPHLGLLASAAIVAVKGGRHGFPLLLPMGRMQRIRMFDLNLTAREIVTASREVSAILPADVAPRAALLVEEVFMTVRERNPPGRKLRGEVTLDFSDGIVMTLRDDGILFDITDADARISSLRTYLVASVMARQQRRLNLVTSGFNRNVFRLA